MTLWTDEEKAEAKQLFSELGRDFKTIADKLDEKFGNDRSPKAIRTHLTYYNDDLTEVVKLRKENASLKQALKLAHHRRKVTVHDYAEKTIRFGVLSDTHLGSVMETPELLDLAYDIYEQEGIERVYLPGDLVTGEKMFRGQEYEIRVHGADAQRDYFVAAFPKREGISTYVIRGNHDSSFWKRSGVDICEQIAFLREDIVYLGPISADVLLRSSGGECKLRLFHPAKGTSYALSYQIQKYIESLTGGEKPNVLLVGHYHKAEYFFYRNIHAVQTGCIEGQTGFMQERNIAANMGFWLVEMLVEHDSVIRFKPEFFPWYVEEEPALEIDEGVV